jgi:putative GTP pyrophosphokinase
MHDLILQQYESRVDLLTTLSKSLTQETQQVLQGLTHIDRVVFRVKEPLSFVKKATDLDNNPPYLDPFVEIEDQVAGRVIVFFISDIDTVLTCLKGIFTPIESFHRKPLRDAEFGYESYHLICIIPPQSQPNGWSARQDLPHTFEIQVRTIFMHAYSEPQHDFAYKAGGDLPPDIRKELAWIAASSWGADRAYERLWRTHIDGKSEDVSG